MSECTEPPNRSWASPKEGWVRGLRHHNPLPSDSGTAKMALLSSIPTPQSSKMPEVINGGKPRLGSARIATMSHVRFLSFDGALGKSFLKLSDTHFRYFEVDPIV